MPDVARTHARAARTAAVAAVVAVLALLLGAAAALPAAQVEPTARTVDDAVLTWGLNAESSGGAYFGGCNFLSAGVAGSTGSSRTWTQGDGFFRASAGAVTVRKPTSSGALGPVTWATRCQNSAGASVNGRTTSDASSSTGMVVQVADGAGWVDPDAGTAEVRWTGSFTVAYYGGMTYWSATDPVLVVGADGTGTLRATLSGYAADRDDPTVWAPVAPRDVTMATLTDVDLGDPAGFRVTPDFLGVVADTADSTAQDRSQSFWGAFPAPFLTFQRLTGQHAYWYTTAGGPDSIQPRKVASPLAVAYTLGDPTSPTSTPTATSSPTTGPTGTPTPTATPTPTSTPSPTSSPSPTSTPSPTHTPTAPTEEFTVDDAQLRWGLNAETGAGAFFGGCNFLSAGVAGDSGGAHVWTESDGLYAPRDGDVRIERPTADGTWATATWATRCLDANGQQVTAGNGGTTRSQVVVDGGTGQVDPVDGTAHVRWTGGFTVAFYGGMTYWSAQDPVLDVAQDGTGTLTATLSGWGTDMADTTRWVRIAPRSVVLATLTDVEVDAATGIVVVPDYLGVQVETGTAVPQATRTAANAAVWGAFPQDFVDFQVRTGQAAYWYTSGGSRDAYKPAASLGVSWTPTSPPVPDPDGTDGPTTPTQPAQPAPPVAPVPPAVAPPGPVLAAAGRGAQPVAGGDAVVGGGGGVVLAGAALGPATTVLATGVAASPPAPSSSAVLAWWLGGAALLVAAALVVLVPRR